MLPSPAHVRAAAQRALQSSTASGTMRVRGWIRTSWPERTAQSTASPLVREATSPLPATPARSLTAAAAALVICEDWRRERWLDHLDRRPVDEPAEPWRTVDRAVAPNGDRHPR